MKKISIYIVSLLLLASCNGETLIDKNLLEKSYDTSLQSLDLRDLSLAMIPDFSVFGTGTSFENAQSIDLSGNDIEFLEIDKLAYFEGLREIYLADNEIKVVNNLDINADILDLSDNRIETAFFQSGAVVRDLNLSGNNFAFGGDMRLPLTVVKLELSENQLQNIDNFGNLTRLKYLDLSGNKLGDKDLIELTGKNHIKYLDIAGNSEMSEERVAKMNVFNKKYLEKLDEEKRTRESLRKTVTQ